MGSSATAAAAGSSITSTSITRVHGSIDKNYCQATVGRDEDRAGGWFGADRGDPQARLRRRRGGRALALGRRALGRAHARAVDGGAGGRRRARSTSPGGPSTAATPRPTGARSWTRGWSRRSRCARRSSAPPIPPRVWLQSSTATIYADTYGAPNAEDGVLGGNEPDLPDTWRFSIDVARSWEEAAAGAPVRTVLMRSAMVMSPDRGGVFDTLYGSSARGLGGRAGERAPVRLLDPRARLRRRHAAADRARGPLRPGQPGLAEPAALRGLHARAARGRGRPGRAARDALDARARRVLHAHGDRAGAQEPPRRARPAARRRASRSSTRSGRRPRGSSWHGGDRRVAADRARSRPAAARSRPGARASAAGPAARRSRRSGSGRAARGSSRGRIRSQ